MLSKCFALDWWHSLNTGTHCQTCGASICILPLTIGGIWKDSNSYAIVRFLHIPGQFFHKMVVSHETGPPPQQLQHAKVISTGQKLVLLGVGTMYTPCLEETVGVDALLALPIAKEWNLKLWLQGKLNNLEMELTIGNGFAVSGGSFSSGMGTAMWIIRERTASIILLGCGQHQVPKQIMVNFAASSYLVIFASKHNTTHNLISM